MKNTSWMMLICCLGPLVFLTAGSALGLNKENAAWVVIPLMLLMCFMMMRKGGRCCGGHRENKPDVDKNEGEKKSGCH